MENKIVIANLKMNQTLDEVKIYLNEINKISNDNVVICPTAIFIPYFVNNNYHVGIQNVYSKNEGAYTGEISPQQAASLEVEYVLLGHSERRQILKETDEEINKKVKESLKYNLKVVLCIGETIEEKASYTTVLRNQLIEGLKGVENFQNIIIAYEPVWAIGTGLTPTIQDIKQSISFIKQVVEEQFDYKDIPVLYGGSVNEKNISSINEVNNLSGYLVGGASLDPDKLLTIIEVAVS